MITGRGPGAPSVTPDVVSTPWHPARGKPGGQAVDLSAIRRTDAIIDLIAGRRLLRPHALGDPAVALLSSLAADVDAAIGAGLAAAVRSAACARLGAAARPAAGSCVAAGPGSARPARPAAGPQRTGRPAGRHRRPARPSVITVAAATMMSVAAAVAATGLLVVSMLSRLGGRASGQRPGP